MKLNELETHRLGQNRICWTCGDSTLLEDKESVLALSEAKRIIGNKFPKLNEGEMKILKNIWIDAGPKKSWKYMLSAVKELGRTYAYITIHPPNRFGFCAPFFIAERVAGKTEENHKP